MERVKAALAEIREFCTASYEIKEKKRLIGDIYNLVKRHPSPRLTQELAEMQSSVRELETKYPETPEAQLLGTQLLAEMTELCQILRSSRREDNGREARIPRESTGRGNPKRAWQFKIYKDGHLVSGRDLLEVGKDTGIPVLLRTNGFQISVPRETANWIRQNPNEASAAGLSFEENTQQ